MRTPLHRHVPASVPVRWLHVSDELDVGSYLTGGELLLTTGRRWASHPEGLTAYIDQLVEVGAAGLLLRLGNDSSPPPAVVDRAQHHSFPLVLLQTRIAFVDVMEVVHRAILANEAGRLREVQKFQPDIAGLVRREVDRVRQVGGLLRQFGDPEAS